MNLNEYSPYFGIKPTDLGDEDFIHLITFFKLLNLVENPMVSLVIPVYRAKETLLAHIYSLSKLKTILPFEVLFVDNNADEETLSILEDLGANVIKEKTQGITHARQKGLEEARGEVVCTMDPDTLYEPHYIDKMAIPFFFDKELVLCFSVSRSYEHGIHESLKMKIRNYLKASYFRLKLLQSPQKRMKFIRAACLAIRKKKFLEIGYRTDLKAVAGCDDGLVAIDLHNSGSSKYVSTMVYTALPPKREPGKSFPYCNEKYINIKDNKEAILNY